jgi:hypothetical protein
MSFDLFVQVLTKELNLVPQVSSNRSPRTPRSLDLGSTAKYVQEEVFRRQLQAEQIKQKITGDTGLLKGLMHDLERGLFELVKTGSPEAPYKILCTFFSMLGWTKFDMLRYDDVLDQFMNQLPFEP